MTARRTKEPLVERRAQPIVYAMPPSSHDSGSVMAVLETKVDALVRQGTETNETLRSLTRAVTQLAVIEERQTADRAAVDRAFGEIKSVQGSIDKIERDHDIRLKALENKAPVNDLSNNFLIKVGWLIISAVVGAVLMLVLAKPANQTPVFIQQAPTAHAAKPAR